jgi:hypothetical protein
MNKPREFWIYISECPSANCPVVDVRPPEDELDRYYHAREVTPKDAEREAAVKELVEALRFAVERYNTGYELHEVYEKSKEALAKWEAVNK